MHLFRFMARGTVMFQQGTVLFGKIVAPSLVSSVFSLINVISIPWSGDEPSFQADSTNGYSFVLQANLTACPNGCLRPVGLAFDHTGRLCVTLHLI